MPMTPDAAKQYKPRRTPGSLDDVIYPETREKMAAAKEDVAGRKTEAATEAAYNKAAGLKKGGTASSRGDGIAQRGKTKGMMVMCGGGMAKRK